MTTENTEDNNQMIVESTPAKTYASEEQLLNTSFGGSISVKDKTIPVFCIKDFSIEDSNGNLVSLMEEGSSRLVFSKEMVLKGSIVSPFVKKTINKTSPLMQDNETNHYEPKWHSETIVDSYDSIVNVTPIIEEGSQSKRRSAKEGGRSKSTKQKTTEAPANSEDEEHPGSTSGRRKNPSKKEEDGAPPKRRRTKKVKKEGDDDDEDEDETPKRKQRKSKVKQEGEDSSDDETPVKTKKRKSKDEDRAHYPTTKIAKMTEEELANSISRRTRSTNPIETVELLEIPRRKTRTHEVVSYDDVPDVEFTEGYTTPTGVTLLSLGTINPSPAFQNSGMIFPVGFKSKRLHASLLSVSEKIYYISEVLQSDENTPIFRVYPESNPEMVFEGTSSSGAWKKVLYAISDFRVEHGLPESGKSISGTEQFGFACPIVKKMIERMDPDHTCQVYWRARIPQDDGADDSSFDEPSDSEGSFRFDISDNGDLSVDSDDLMSEEKDDSEDLGDLEDLEDLENLGNVGNQVDKMEAEDVDTDDEKPEPTKESDEEPEGEHESEMVPFKKFKLEKDSFLVVRCRMVEEGYEAEDSLIDDVLNVAMPVKKQPKQSKKQDSKSKPQSKETSTRKKDSKDSDNLEYKPKSKPGRRGKTKSEAIPEAPTGSVFDTDFSKYFKKKKVGRKPKILTYTENIAKFDVSGTYRMQFEATKVEGQRMRVRVSPLDSSIKNGYNSCGVLCQRIMQQIEFDLKFNDVGHIMQLLYTFRLFSTRQSRIDAPTAIEFLEKLTTCGISAVQTEAEAILKLFDSRKDLRKRGRKSQDASGEKASKVQKVEQPHTDFMFATEKIKRPSKVMSSDMSVSIPIKSWGIYYHEKESFIYAQSKNALYILRCNTIQTNPSPAYAPFFLREKRFFEICQQIYSIYKEFQDNGQDLQYNEVLSALWNNNTCDDIIIVEEDLIVEYPSIVREMRDLEKHSKVAYSPYFYGNNDFISNLQFRYEMWEENNANPAYLFAITDDLSMAEGRSSFLHFDQYLVGSISQGTLPSSSDSVYPTTHTFHEEGLTSKDWFLILEIWHFIQGYASILGITETPLQLNKKAFLNQPSSDLIQNAYHILTRYLNNDMVKRDISLRRQMKDPNWFINGIFTTKRSGIFCDINNYDSYIRGYFDPAAFAIENLEDVKDRMQYILITLMRHPDCVGFLHPVDESKHDVPGYSDIIKTPMDFHTICRRFVSDWYFEEQTEEGTSRGKGIRGVIEDILLIYSNCRIYNGSDSSIYRYQTQMLYLTEGLIRQWILPLDESVADLISQRNVEHDDSDDDITSRRGKIKSSVSSKDTTIMIDATHINPILESLKTTDITMLPIADQVRILASLYKLVRWSMDLINERENREQALKSLQQGYSSITNQLQELKAVYSQQEHTLRTNFMNRIKNATKVKNSAAMQRSSYKPREDSDFSEERDLAVFLKKRTKIISDIVAKMKQTNTELINMHKSVWSPKPLGVDRNQNEYYFFPMEVPSRLWIYNPHTETWSYIWHPNEFQQLLKWIDNRGSDEQYLYSALLLIKKQLLTAFTNNLEFPVITSSRPVRETDDLVIQEMDGVFELFQTSDTYFGIPCISQDRVMSTARKSAALPAITNNVFNSMFTTAPNDDVAYVKSIIANYNTTDFSLKDYCDLILRIEDCIHTTVDTTFIYTDWIITRIFWRQRIAQCTTFAEANFYVSDLESNCVDFSVVDALTNSIEREQFLQQYEDTGKNMPRIPDVGETVIYYKQGHEDAKTSFIQSNVLSGIYQYDEPTFSRDCVCKVQSITYYWGRGNPFLRMSLKTIHNVIPSSMVRSYYASMEDEEIAIDPERGVEEEDSSTVINCTVWMETTNSDFVIPFDVYCMAFANNFHVGDRFRMWFQGIESQVTSRKKGKSSRLEGSYLHGTVVAIEETEGALFPWECITAKWEANSVEAGTDRINPWECEIESKVQKEKTRESKPQQRSDVHRMSEEEFQEVRKKVEEIARTHRAEEGEKFYRFLVRFWAERGMEIQKPIMSFQELDLGLFWNMMQAFGGYDAVVSTKGCWQTMFTLLPNYRTSNTSGPTQLHRIYLRLMYQYEKELREEKGLPPIGEPRLPVATTPSRIGQPPAKSSQPADEEEKRDIMMYDASPGVLFLSKKLKELENLKAYYQNKLKSLTNSLNYKVGDITTMKETIENDKAFVHIVNGNINVLKKKSERMTRFMVSLKQLLNYYLYAYLLNTVSNVHM